MAVKKGLHVAVPCVEVNVHMQTRVLKGLDEFLIQIMEWL